MLDLTANFLREIEDVLRRNCPSPEDDLIKLSQIAAHLPDNEVGARVRILVLDIDDFVAQIRWNLGQVLLLLEQHPQIASTAEPEAPIEKIVSENVMPAKAMLLLRGYIPDADRVLYSDLAESRRSGIVAGWIYHMMIDNAIYRLMAAFDRLAQILWYVAKLPTYRENGESVKVYFRSRKMEKVDKIIQSEQSKQLLSIAEGPLLNYVISYRDGYSHDMKVYSQVAGTRPTEEWIGEDGKRYVIQYDKFDSETLFSLANATYHQFTEALKLAIQIIEENLLRKDAPEI